MEKLKEILLKVFLFFNSAKNNIKKEKKIYQNDEFKETTSERWNSSKISKRFPVDNDDELKNFDDSEKDDSFKNILSPNLKVKNHSKKKQGSPSFEKKNHSVLQELNKTKKLLFPIRRIV